MANTVEILISAGLVGLAVALYLKKDGPLLESDSPDGPAPPTHGSKAKKNKAGKGKKSTTKPTANGQAKQTEGNTDSEVAETEDEPAPPSNKVQKPVPVKAPAILEPPVAASKSKKKKSKSAAGSAAGSGIITGVTPAPAPSAVKEEPKQPSLTQVQEEQEREKKEEEEKKENQKKTAAERLLPKARKTVVDDMLNPEINPPSTIERVIRVAPDTPEDGSEIEAVDIEEGWEGVPIKKRGKSTPRSVTPNLKNSSSGISTAGSFAVLASPTHEGEPSKKQKQNRKKAEGKKAQKAEEEADRLQRLASHKRGLEAARIEELHGKSGSRGGHTFSASSKAVSGGMSAKVDTNGKLIWE